MVRVYGLAYCSGDDGLSWQRLISTSSPSMQTLGTVWTCTQTITISEHHALLAIVTYTRIAPKQVQQAVPSRYDTTR